MFMETLRCVQESVWEEGVIIRPAAAHFERIEGLVMGRLTDHREEYIHRLLEELKQSRESLQQKQLEHEQELSKLRDLYEEELDQSYSRTKRRSVELEVKKHIEVRMKEIESNYILKVVHEQELMRVRSQPCNRCEILRTEMKQLEEQNLSLRKELLRSQQDCNDQMTRETDGRSRLCNDSKGTAMLEDQAEIIYENDQAFEQTSRKGSNYHARKAQRNDAVDGYSLTASFQKGFHSPNHSKERAAVGDTDLQTELQSIRKNLRERHNKLMSSSKASWRPEGLNLNDSELNQSTNYGLLPTLKRNQSTVNFKIVSKDQLEESVREDNVKQLTRALSKESMGRFDNKRPKPAAQDNRRTQQRTDIQSPEQNPPRRSQMNRQKMEPSSTRASNKEKAAYTFKYLNLKV